MRPPPSLRLLATAGSLLAITASFAPSFAQSQSAPEPFTNSLGLRMLPVASGEFAMGSTVAPANWDEAPVRRVKIAAPFFVSETEVTAEQLLRFRATATVNPEYSPYAAGVSWRDAMAFCAWLSLRESRAYRLPTEAEWEYVCRAGRTDEAVAVARQSWETTLGTANPWGVKNMLSGPAEWCFDWYGEYAFDDATDPVGVDAGFMRVVRGGYLDVAQKFPPDPYLRPSNRAGAPPRFGPFFDGMPNPQSYGQHRIGFRIVLGPLLKTKPSPSSVSYARQGVKPVVAEVKRGPDPTKPYFRKRRLPPILPQNTPPDIIKGTGLHPLFRPNLHNPGFDVLPNGDALLVFSSARHEFEPEVSLMAARLRFGAEQWDMPSPFLDTPGAADHAPLLWHDSERLWLFWGHPYTEGHFPFQFVTSRDFGLSWSDVTFPHITGPLGPGLDRPQPVNSVIIDQAGAMHLAVDAAGGDPPGSQSMLWKSENGGDRWRDTQGRTFGRHTSFAVLKDGSILGFSGGNAGSENSLPRSTSRDGGATYELGKTPFLPLPGGERPSLLRLASGRLFFAGDFQPLKDGATPAAVTATGCYVALSDDDGETWRLKRLPGVFSKKLGRPSLGQSVARQGPNGLVHLIATSHQPALHFEFNEAWIISDATFADDDPAMERSAVTKVSDVEGHADVYGENKPRILWSLGTADDGRALLDGMEIWHYANGTKQREATYVRGVKLGPEAYWSADGVKLWEWLHDANGTSIWKTYWPDGTPRSESTWRNQEFVPGTGKFFEHVAK